MALSPTTSRGGVTNAVQTGGLVLGLQALMVPVVAGNFSANDIHLVRYIVPQTGTLHDVGVFCVTQSGNISLAVYDSGDAAANTLTRLATSGAVAVAASNAWQTFDPALAVVAGQQIFLALSCNNAVATFESVNNPDNNGYWSLPTAFLATAAAPGRIAVRAAASHPAPATIASGAFLGSFLLESFIARIS